MASTKAIADLSLAESAGDATINTMVPRKVTGTDPFHGYSILKPADTAWLAPQQSRHPGVIAAVLAIVLTAAAGRLLMPLVTESTPKLSVLDSAKPAPLKIIRARQQSFVRPMPTTPAASLPAPEMFRWARLKR